ncbi:MAG TPA: hypothetical protein VIX59_10740 [Candidatus Binataceae bacterium]
MILFAFFLVLIVARYPSETLPRLARLAVIGAVAAIVTLYFWLPFLMGKPYLNEIPYSKAFGMKPMFGHEGWSVALRLLDNRRLPVLNFLAILGLGYAIYTRDRAARLILTFSIMWLSLYLVTAAVPRMRFALPMHELLPSRRFSGPVDAAAILLIGLAGECVLRICRPLRQPWRAGIPALLFLLLMLPALRERYVDYARNAQQVARVAALLDADKDYYTILSRIRELPPGRLVWRSGRFDLYSPAWFLTFYDITTLDFGQGLSLNAGVTKLFNISKPNSYDLFNVTYVVIPAAAPRLDFFELLLKTSTYALYHVKTSGYAKFGSLLPSPRVRFKTIKAQRFMQRTNLAWLTSDDAAAGKFIPWRYPPGRRLPENITASGGETTGTITAEEASADRINLSVQCQQPSTLVLKVTFHPKWQVTIDGLRVRTFMVSPSYIGLLVPAGQHHIVAEYRSGGFKKALLLLSVCALLAAVVLRRRLNEPAELALAAISRYWPKAGHK